MKNVMKKIFVGLLVLAMLMTLASCGETPTQTSKENQGPSQGETKDSGEENKMAEYDETKKNLTGKAVEVKTEMIPATKEECLDAIMASMWAYYDKGYLSQYDETYLTVEGYRFSYRNTAFQAPDFGTRDEFHYNVCNTFVQGVYNDAFGMYDYHEPEGFMYVTKSYRKFTGAHVVYMVTDPTENELKTEVIPKVKELLQPGDFICGYGETGHVMLFLGDIYGDGKNYLAHSWGANANAEGMERYEENGSINIQTDEDLLYSDSGRWYLGSMKRCSSHVVILRLMDADFFPNAMTQVVASRMQYPRMTIEKYLSVPMMHSVVNGEKLTLNVEVANKGTEDYKGLRIAENLPEGTKLISGEQEVTVDIKAGETYTFSLELEIEATAGQSITFPHGAVAEIPTKEITVNVGAGHIQGDVATKIADTAKKLATKGVNKEPLGFVNQVYLNATGVDLGLPKTVQDYLSLTLKAKASRNCDEKMFNWKPEDDENKMLFRMQVPKMFGGKYFEMNKNQDSRVMTIRERDLEVGDILIRMTGGSKTSVEAIGDAPVYIYLGDNVAMEIGTAAHQNYVTTFIDYTMMSNFYTVLRPSRIYDFK